MGHFDKLQAGKVVAAEVQARYTEMPVVALGDADTTLTFDDHAGRTLLLGAVTGNRTYTLPADPEDGDCYHFVYVNTAAETENHLISAGTGNARFFDGVIAHLDTNADNVAVYSNGSSNELLTIIDTGYADIWCVADGSTWKIWGSVISASAPTFAD
tara:strand:+ start:602 stop:1072 length:471 start_codon:yes stop_codon:yes gene_type:complete